MQFPNQSGNGVLHITVCWKRVIFQGFQISEQIVSLEILSGSYILQRFCEFRNLPLVRDIHLFASRLNFQTKTFVSWSPDPGAWAVDAFSVCWEDFKPYIFPPFRLQGRVLRNFKVRRTSQML